MVKLKLQRLGRKKLPFFRLIAQEESKDPWDKSNEILGWINPRTKEKELKKERIQYWLDQGAQATNSVHNLLINAGIIQGEKKKAFKISKKRLTKKSADSTDKEGKEDKKTEKPEEVKAEKEPVAEKKEEKKEEIKKEEKPKEKPVEEKAEDKK